VFVNNSAADVILKRSQKMRTPSCRSQSCTRTTFNEWRSRGLLMNRSSCDLNKSHIWESVSSVGMLVSCPWQTTIFSFCL